MAITYFEGFDHFQAARFSERQGIILAGGGAGLEMIAGRYGGQAWGIFNTGFGYASYSNPLGLAEFILHMDWNFRAAMNNAIFLRLDLNPGDVVGGIVDCQYLFRTTTDRRLQIYSQSSTGRKFDEGTLVFQTPASFLLASTWYNVQIVSSATAFEVWVDGIKIWSVAGNIGTIAYFTYIWEDLGFTGVWYDNVVITDPNVLVGLTSRVENLACQVVITSANYIVQMHPNDPSQQNWQVYNGLPFGDPHVYGEHPEFDCYEFADFTAFAFPIYAAGIKVRFRGESGTPGTVVPVFQSPVLGQPPAQLGSLGLSTINYAFGQHIYNTNLDDGGNWNHVLLNLMRFGMTCTTPGLRVRYSQVVLERVVLGSNNAALSGAKYEVKE